MASFAKEYGAIHIAAPAKIPTPLQEPTSSSLFKTLASIASIDFKRLWSFGNKPTNDARRRAELSRFVIAETDNAEKDSTGMNGPSLQSPEGTAGSFEVDPTGDESSLSHEALESLIFEPATVERHEIEPLHCLRRMNEIRAFLQIANRLELVGELEEFDVAPQRVEVLVNKVAARRKSGNRETYVERSDSWETITLTSHTEQSTQSDLKVDEEPFEILRLSSKHASRSADVGDFSQRSHPPRDQDQDMGIDSSARNQQKKLVKRALNKLRKKSRKVKKTILVCFARVDTLSQD